MPGPMSERSNEMYAGIKVCTESYALMSEKLQPNVYWPKDMIIVK